MPYMVCTLRFARAINVHEPGLQVAYRHCACLAFRTQIRMGEYTLWVQPAQAPPSYGGYPALQSCWSPTSYDLAFSEAVSDTEQINTSLAKRQRALVWSTSPFRYVLALRPVAHPHTQREATLVPTAMSSAAAADPPAVALTRRTATRATVESRGTAAAGERTATGGSTLRRRHEMAACPLTAASQGVCMDAGPSFCWTCPVLSCMCSCRVTLSGGSDHKSCCLHCKYVLACAAPLAPCRMDGGPYGPRRGPPGSREEDQPWGYRGGPPGM